MKFTYNKVEYELMFVHLAGSHLYGNSTPESDWDYRGVFIAPPETKLGLIGSIEQMEGIDVYKALTAAGLDLEYTDDIVLYEVNRFAKLAIDNNPNIIDSLCHDYTKNYSIYCSDKGERLLCNRHLFLSSKLKFTFSGYAMAQLKKIKGHNKWINEFPHTDTVLTVLKSYVELKAIDFDWICDNFGGQVAEKITGETPQKNTKVPECIQWSKFVNDTRLPDEVEKYRLPRLIDYCTPKDLRAKPLDKGDRIHTGEYLAYFLNNSASFRTISNSMLVVYDSGNGIFSKEGNIKANDPETIGEFVCLLSVDKTKYKSDKDYVNKLWSWKCNRNQKRGTLEEKYGYDTKHASHLVRLMECCKDILTTSDYNPTLTGERLQLVKDTRAGKFAYDELLEYAETTDQQLSEMYSTTDLQKSASVKKINKLVLNMQQ